MLAIHTKTGSFVPEWLKYCEEHNISYKEVDCFASDIILQLENCQALLWNWAHHDYRAQLFARQLITSVEKMGISVFPNSATCWHYDDKVGQKYLLESVGAPLVPTYVFYHRDQALRWIEETSFPKVWKLRGGAGSQNVKLVHSKNDARKVIDRSFGKGWSNSRFHPLKDRVWHFRRDRSLRSLLNISRGIGRALIPHENNAKSPLQRDYIYFQDFAPSNLFDIRIIVIGDRAFGKKRYVRKGDFRASGGGVDDYEPSIIPSDCIEYAFQVSSALSVKCCAFDFVQIGGDWKIVEISYAFAPTAFSKCPGYWDQALVWHDAPVTPERFMIEDLLTGIAGGKQLR